MNRIGKAENKKVVMAARTLSVLTLFLFTAGTTFPLQARTPAGAKVPAARHNSWGRGAAMPTALKFTMTGVIGGKVYVVGGVTDTAVVTKNLVYNPVTNTWSSKAALPGQPAMPPVRW